MPRTTQPRGFVIVVVLAIAAALTVIVAAQLVTAHHAQVVGIRADEEAKARSIAEACLDQLTQYAQDDVPANHVDFDHLLTHDGIAGNADDYVPFGVAANIVQIPPTATGALHHWEVVDVLPGSGGLCAARFDDDSDDFRPVGAAGSTNNTPGLVEDTGTDTNNGDRDLAVYLTVIGLYPASTPASAYQGAHTRVTLRRLIQKQNSITVLQPAVRATSITMNNNALICGAGGIQSTVGLTTSNNDCICGNTQSSCAGVGCPRSGQTCSACPTGCAPASLSPPPAIVAPVDIHWGNLALLSDQVFGAPPRAYPFPPAPPQALGEGVGLAGTPDPDPLYSIATAAGGPGSATPVCSFYASEEPWDNPTPSGLASGLKVYVWDVKDVDARATLEGLAGTALPGIPGAPAPISCAAQPPGDPPAPCKWDPRNPTASARITCAAGQSPCWKLVATLDNTNHEIVGMDGAARGWNEATGGGDDDDATQNEFHPHRNLAIPNVAGGQMFGTGSAATTLCGAPTACQNCTAALSANPHYFVKKTTSHYLFDAVTNGVAVTPSIFFGKSFAGIVAIGSGGVANVHIRDVGDNAGGALNVSFVTDGTVLAEGDYGICAATADCTALSARKHETGACRLNGIFGGTASPEVVAENGSNPGDRDDTRPPTTGAPAGLPPGTDNIGEPGGTAIKAGSDVRIKDNSSTIVGDVRGASVYLPDNNCLIGSVIGYGATTAPGCSSAGGACTAAAVCYDNDGTNIGDVHSMADIAMKNNPTIWGDVAAKGSICVKNNARVEGTLAAGVSVVMQNNPKIVNDNAVATGIVATQNPALTSFMETTW